MRHLLLVGLIAVILAASVALANEYFDKVMSEDDQIVKLSSGMLVKVLKKGTGDKSPKVDTPCKMHYTGWLTPDQGSKKFDSSVDRGQPLTFAPNQVIRGWTEALQMMREGDQWKIYIPYSMAYGDAGAGGVIPGRADLIFEMQMLSVEGAGKSADEAATLFKESSGKDYDSITV